MCQDEISDAIRTPDEVLRDLPDFPYTSQYRSFEGLRLAHLDEGSGPPVWFMHGEPTWSFLWRAVFAPVVAAGFRAIVPDLPGFGRSDKPVDLGWYSYDRHTAAMEALLEDLDLTGATMVVHDWGGPIGLRLAVDHAARFDRLVILDTGLATGRGGMSEQWLAFREYVRRTEDLPISMLVNAGCVSELPADVRAAYDAPYPMAVSKAGPRSFPDLVPTAPGAPGAATGRRLIAALRDDDRPTLALWGEHDPVLSLDLGRRFCAAIGRDPPEVVQGAGHFLQEDRGAQIGERIATWLTNG
jgi:haloalkane dehalogenase